MNIRYFIILLFFTVVGKNYCQKNDTLIWFKGSNIKWTSCYKVYVTDDSQNISASISCDSIGKVEIKGEPMFVIRMLLECIEKNQKEIHQLKEDAYQLTEATKYFYNGIKNSYYKDVKNNKAVVRFEKEMKKHNYTVDKIKTQ